MPQALKQALTGLLVLALGTLAGTLHGRRLQAILIAVAVVVALILAMNLAWTHLRRPGLHIIAGTGSGFQRPRGMTNEEQLAELRSPDPARQGDFVATLKVEETKGVKATCVRAHITEITPAVNGISAIVLPWNTPDGPETIDLPARGHAYLILYETRNVTRPDGRVHTAVNWSGSLGALLNQGDIRFTVEAIDEHDRVIGRERFFMQRFAPHVTPGRTAFPIPVLASHARSESAQ